MISQTTALSKTQVTFPPEHEKNSLTRDSARARLVRSREPRAESREPRAESREPRAESREPRAESREPRAESREPRAEPRPWRGSPSRLSSPPRATLLRREHHPAAGTALPGTSRVPERAGRPMKPVVSPARALARAGLAALACIALLAFAAPAWAQTTVTLVSNIGQADGGQGALQTFDQAQEFNTGDNTGGYTLTSVEIHLASSGEGDAHVANFTVAIWSSDMGQPMTSLGTLTHPTFPSDPATGVYEFTTSGIDLEAETAYFVVVDSTGVNIYNIQNTASDSEDSGGESGWSIGDNSQYRSKSQTGFYTIFGESKEIRINGTVKSGGNPTPEFSIADASATEGSDVSFTVTLSAASTDTVTVDYATSVETGDTAESNDFTAATGTLTFAAGDLTKTVSVATVSDTVNEIDETFTLTLSNASGATLPTDPTATGTITDDDSTTVSINSVTVAEDDGTATLTVTLSHAVEEGLEMTAETANVTAFNGLDYTGVSKILEFGSADTTKTFTIDLLTDTLSPHISPILLQGIK